MDNVQTKPRLVFFQYKYDERLPEFLLIHKHEHVKCLSEFFEVTVIHEDCDYQQICDKYEPDVALFESGVNHETCRRPKIENIRSCSEIPKIALHNADGFCNARAGFLSDMDHWGIETFFAISITAAEHTPEIADKLITWPVFVDDAIYRDYGSWKSIPVLLSGNRNQLYPWRNKIINLVPKYYPSLICQHPGYGPRTGKTHVMVGEDYARTINASCFVPACGTVAKEVVRKHFEIPACNSCLIAEKSPGLEAAGFIDMINCIFADEHDVLDKLDHLFRNAEELERITKSGHQLVHSRHTMKQRDQIFQWFSLHKKLKASQRIVQLNPFEPLMVVEKSSGIENSHIISNGLHLSLLSQGDEKLWGGKYEEAESYYFKCINYMRWMPEPKLRLTLCNLYQGNATMALSCIADPIQFILVQYKAVDPDPVEWAYFIISFLCLGKLDVAIKHSGQFPWLRHPELDRARWAAHVLQNRRIDEPLLNDNMQERRCSMHRLPSRSLEEWIEQLCVMLKACGQRAMAETLARCLSLEAETFQKGQANARANSEISVKYDGEHNEKWRRYNLIFFFKKRLFLRKLRLTLKHSVADFLHRFERKFGYFLPYRLSEMRDDEFFKAIQNLTSEVEIKTALLIGAVPGAGSTEAFLTGALQNKSKPSVFCISSAKRGYIKQKKYSAYGSITTWYQLCSRQEKLIEELEKTVEQIRNDNRTKSFDIVLIDGSELKPKSDNNAFLEIELHQAKFVLLDDINSVSNFHNYDGLLRDPSFSLIAHNPGLRNGYAIFKKNGSAEDVSAHREANSYLTGS